MRHELILHEFIANAVKPNFKINSKSRMGAISTWWDVLPLKYESGWCPAYISYYGGVVKVAAGYSSSRVTEINLADPDAAEKILEAVQWGWDSCPDFDYYNTKSKHISSCEDNDGL